MMIPSWINDYVGIPYKPSGRSMEGANCWGLLWLIDQEHTHFGVPNLTGVDAEGYELKELEKIAKGETWLHARMIERGKEAFADMLLFRFQGYACHVGMVIERGLMINARPGTDSCIERYDGPIWRHRLVGIYRWNS